MEDKKEIKCKCPYCDASIEEKESPICQVCKIRIIRCVECGNLVSSNIEKCPKCGAQV